MPRTLKLTGKWKNITFEELEDFVRAAQAAGAHHHTEITAEVSSSGKIKGLEIELD
ncbi:hypothetical protein [Streptomyces platensis]|uniref:hypothetical protein n=1 Tax=Streptomyces platensis TaxID=58346 RepID=UPI002F91B900|nr:hypothetical protein OG962_37315 [Streptomyces platensis]